MGGEVFLEAHSLHRCVLVESGRVGVERVIPHLREIWGEETSRLDIVTCSPPAGEPLSPSTGPHEYRAAQSFTVNWPATNIA